MLLNTHYNTSVDTKSYTSAINTTDDREKFSLVDSEKIFSIITESLKEIINPLFCLLRNVDSYKETLLNIVKDLILVGIVSINKDILDKYKNFFNQTFIQKEKYDAICEDVSDMLKMAAFQICEVESVGSEQRKILEIFFEEVHFSKEVALERVKKDELDSDKKVLYSLCAIEHILEAVLDEEFFELTGGYKMPKDFIEFGGNLIGSIS